MQSASATMTQPTNISSCTAADLDSCASRTNRLSKNSTTALINPSALSSKPEWPAGLRGRGLSLLISESFWTNAGRPDPARTQFRAPCISLLSDFRARTAPHLPGTYGRGSWHLPTLVLLCRVLRPRLAPPCLGILPQKRLRLISNLPLLCDLFCASAVAGVGCSPCVFCSAIGNLQLICSVRLSACFAKWANADLSQINKCGARLRRTS